MELQVTKVIEELSKIDLATDKVLAGADSAKNAYLADDQKRRKSYEDDLQTSMNARIESYKQKIETEQKQQIQNYRAKTTEELTRLDEEFSKKHTSLAEDIFKQLIAE